MDSERVTALEIARGRWEMDNARLSMHCGCLWMTDGVTHLVTRRIYWCERHRLTPEAIASLTKD